MLYLLNLYFHYFGITKYSNVKYIVTYNTGCPNIKLAYTFFIFPYKFIFQLFNFVTIYKMYNKIQKPISINFKMY